MSWLKSSDTSATNPIVTAPAAWDRDETGIDGPDLVNLLYGLVHRCAVHSAQQDTDYRVSDGMVATYAGPHWRLRAAQAERAGYWARIEGGYQLVADSEHLFHIRLKAEKEWEAQRRKDNGDPTLIVPVRVRDGDGCRYCAKVVDWRARRGNRAGTYDHRTPGHPAKGPEDLVVCCGGCNSARGANPEAFDERCPLLPVPSQPFYGERTIALLAEHGVTVQPSRPGGQSDTAPATPQPAGQRSALPATLRPVGSRASDGDGPAGSGRFRQIDGVPDLTSPGRDGTGTGEGREAASPPVPAPGRRRQRGNRGRVPRPTPKPEDGE